MSNRSKAIRHFVTLGLLASALLVVACAPAVGRATVQYQAQPQDLISAIAEIGITLQPGTAFNFFSINSIGERFITLQATTTGGFSFFFGGSSITLNFSAIQSGEIVSLAASGTGGSASNDAIDQIVAQLDLRFTRVR
jgi:hypothetical protein